MTQPRARARSTFLLTTALAVVTLTAMPGVSAHAVIGDETPSADTFTARINVGDVNRACSGALVDAQWVLTAASCFADHGTAPVAGAPKVKSTATVGSTDLSAHAGTTVGIVELQPRTDRDVVMAKLAQPIANVTPATLASTPPTAGQSMAANGFGRTKADWVAHRAHTGEFTVTSVNDTSLGIDAKAPGSGAICKGDTGGPLLRERDGQREVVGISSRSWQGGCLGTDGKETRTGASAARVDDLGTWIAGVRYRQVFAKQPWKNAELITSGYFTGGSAGGKRHMDLLVRWSDGEVTLFQGGDDRSAEHPFIKEYQLAAAKGLWQHARQITGASLTGSGTDGLVVRWKDGEVTQYTHVDQNGFHEEKQLVAANKPTWRDHARLLTAGRYTDNGLRDDLVVVWSDGEVSLYSDLNTYGIRKEKQLSARNKTWPYARQITSGEFTGNKTGDLVVRWADGEATLYSGVDTDGLHEETKLRPSQSPWKDATVVTAGAFAGNERPNDILVRWANGSVSLYPGVNSTGTHREVKLAP